MSHHHDHDDHHSHHGAGHQHGNIEMTFAEKIEKLLSHWIQHNDDHASTYRGWADQARQNHLAEVAAIIEEAAEMNLAINEKFEKAKLLIQSL